MSLKPARFFVEFQDSDLVAHARKKYGEDFDPELVTCSRSFEKRAEALRFFRACEDRRECPSLYERKNLRDVTPPEDPPGLLWEWDTDQVEVQS